LKHQPRDEKGANGDNKSSIEDEPTSDKETNATTDPMNVDTESKAMGTRVLHVWQEHKNTRELFKNVVSEKDLKQKQVLFQELIKEISSHENAEQSVIDPAYQNLTKDEETLKMARQQESALKQKLMDLDKEYGDKMDDSFNSKFQMTQPDFFQHMEMEEMKIFPALEKGLKKEELDGLNTSFDKVKKGVSEPGKAVDAMITEQPKLAPMQEGTEKIEPAAMTK